MSFASPHPLSMKVMRLCQPQQTNAVDSVHTCSLAAGALLAGDSLATLALPPDFGKICAGQTLTCYVAVKNFSAYPIPKLWITGELEQVDTQKRFPLVDRRVIDGQADNIKQNESQRFDERGSRVVDMLHPGEHTNFIISHLLKGTGAHCLRINARYTELDGGPSLVYKRSYRFNVQNAFNIDYSVEQTMTNSDPHSTAANIDVVLENQTDFNMCINDIAMKCAPLCRVSEDNDSEEEQTEYQLQTYVLSSRKRLLKPGATIRKSYFAQRKLVLPHENSNPNDETQAFQLAPLDTTEVGQINVEWSTNLGEKGMWTSPLIKSDKLIPGNCHLCVSCPSFVGPDKTCEIQGSLTNTSRSHQTQSRFLVEIHSSSDDVMLAGPVTFRTPFMVVCEVVEFSLAAVILSPGSHTLRVDVYGENIQGAVDRGHRLESKEIPLPS
eukprot:gb/GECG01000203.1/.p1 GENE.gb/GECG01000203.1/~~gb/GECG01000203.1/.p1  ORF type:complete len:439 (+),score=40.75 gb/GECG01000203.1/:1-1317(+)